MLLKYFLSLFLLAISGLIWCSLEFNLSSLRLVFMCFAVAACGILNFMYFIPFKFKALAYLIPGVLAFVLTLFVTGSNVEEKFLGFFGIVNLVLGLFWGLISKNNLSFFKQDKSNKN